MGKAAAYGFYGVYTFFRASCIFPDDCFYPVSYTHLDVYKRQEYSYLKDSGNAMLFSNTNTAGIMAGFSIVLAVVLYGKRNYNKNLVIAFGIYNIIALILFGCRSADVAAIAIVILVIAEKKLLRIRKEILIAGILVMCIATL